MHVSSFYSFNHQSVWTQAYDLAAGRADYFGNLPNLAARVMALAAPGQVLLEGFPGFGLELLHRDELSALLPQQPSRMHGDPDYEAVEVLQLGKYPIKASVCLLVTHSMNNEHCWKLQYQ